MNLKTTKSYQVLIFKELLNNFFSFSLIYYSLQGEEKVYLQICKFWGEFDFFSTVLSQAGNLLLRF